MVIFKAICLAIAIFTSLLYFNNLVIDLASSFSLNFTLHTPEVEKKRDEETIRFARYRLILAVIMSIFWTLVVFLP